MPKVLKLCPQKNLNFRIKLNLSTFGLYIDIDGVVSRGHEVLQPAKKAFEKWMFYEGKPNIPHVFLTNSGTSSPQQKSKYLKNLLNCNISESQIIMSYNPLAYFKYFDKKFCLVSGQGPLNQIAKKLHIDNSLSMEYIDKRFPLLDMVANEKREIEVSDSQNPQISKIEALLLFGEPVKWETSLQIMIDILVTNGYIDKKMEKFPYPHIPVISCNADFLWMAQWKNPRFGHGAFLLCLESLYKKLTGNHLMYTAILGKPNELNYLCAEKAIVENCPNQAEQIKTIYAIGDNIESDIVGGNLYNKLLQQIQNNNLKCETYKDILMNKPYASLIDWSQLKILNKSQIIQCKTILVQTGVYKSEFDDERRKAYHLSYNHEYFNIDQNMKKPNYIVENFFQAIELIYELEKL